MEATESLQGSYDDMEIRMFQEGQDKYYAEMIAVNGRHCGGELPSIPEEQWDRMRDTREYGAQLFQWLLRPGSEMEQTFLRARWKVEETSSARLRLRLWLDPGSETLHKIWWEALYDPQRDAPVALSAALSRYVTSDAPPALPVGQRPIRMLLVTSNPEGLDKFGCAPLNANLEQGTVQRATRGLGESLRTEQLMNPSPDSLRAYLRERQPHILYMQAHAIYREPQGEMLLAGQNGTATPVPFEHIVELIARSGDVPPQLIFLALPATARTDFRYSLSTLARRLVEAGVQASVALHAPIDQEKVIDFSEQFFAVLTRRGVIDEAVASARSRIYLANNPSEWCWTFPVLYMRTPDAVLFQPLPREIEEGLRFLSGKFR